MNERITSITWARARAAYLAGDTAGAVCTRFRIGRSAFYAAAQAGGWRRSDPAPATGPDGGESPAPPGEALPCVDLAEAAMARASDAVMGGRLHEAQGWTRLAADLRRLALQETGRDSWSQALGGVIDDEARGRCIASRLDALPDSRDSPDSYRTPVSAITHEENRLIAAKPDSVDSPPPTGLRNPAAPPRTLNAMQARASAEAAKLHAQDRRTPHQTRTGP